MTNFKPFVSIAFAALALVITSQASAANIYKEGTEGYRMAEMAERFVGDSVTTIFLVSDDVEDTVNQISRPLLDQSGIGLETIGYLIRDAEGAFENLPRSVTAYALAGSNVPANAERTQVCGVIFRTAEEATDETLFHELMHCKSGEFLPTKEYLEPRYPVYMQVKDQVSKPVFVSMFEEAIAAHLQVAYKVNEGVDLGYRMVVGESMLQQNTENSIGIRNAQHALDFCGQQGRCSTDPVVLAKQLVRDEAYVDQMVQDMLELKDKY